MQPASATGTLALSGEEPKRVGGSSRVRMCVGCGQKVPLAEARGGMLRLAWIQGAEEARFVVDLTGRAPGRGSWVHTRARCLRRAAERGLARSVRSPGRLDRETLMAELRAACERRLDGLLGAARRSGQLAIGTTAVERAFAADRVWLCLLASDAAAAARGQVVGRMAAEDRVVVWGTKASLGALRRSRGDVALVAVLSEGIAREVRSTIGLVDGVDREEEERSHGRAPGRELASGARPGSRARGARGTERPATS